MNDTELCRLYAAGCNPSAPDPIEGSPETIHCSFSVSCNGNSDEVDAVARSALAAVLLNHSIGSDSEIWKSVLAPKFQENCGPAVSKEDIRKRLELPIEERLAAEANARWSIKMFINAFDDDLGLRKWRFGGSTILDENNLNVILEIPDYLCPLQSFLWLYKGSGAIQVERI